VSYLNDFLLLLFIQLTKKEPNCYNFVEVMEIMRNSPFCLDE